MLSSDRPWASDRPKVRPTPGAIAIVKGDPPQVLLADSAAVMSRLIALRVVATSSPSDFAADTLAKIRQALLDERWADAVLAWMEATDTFIDVYDEYVPVWSEAEVGEQHTVLEVRVARIFDDR